MLLQDINVRLSGLYVMKSFFLRIVQKQLLISGVIDWNLKKKLF